MAVQFSGSLNLTGSLNVSSGITGSLFGSASWAINSTKPISSLGTNNIYSTQPAAAIPGFANSNNIILGLNAGSGSTYLGTSNLLGPSAGRDMGVLTVAVNNNFFGNQAGRYAEAVSNSNFFGSFSGYDADNAEQSNFFGRNSGHSAYNASYSTLIGLNAGRNSELTNGIGRNNIIIGTNITLENGRTDSINLGGLIFGTGSYFNDNESSYPFSDSANGRIGINQPLPEFSLDVSGSGRYTNGVSVSGSFLVSGSTIQIGNNTLTGNTVLSGSINISGSTTFDGSHVLRGSNKITGNTELSGSFEVSGSSNFKNSIFIVTGSAFFTGSHRVTGETIISGSIHIASGSGYYRGDHKLFNYGQWGSLEIQSGSANTAYAMKLGTQLDGAEGIRITNNGSGFPTRITVDYSGLYNIQFSSQLTNTNNTNITFDIWFAYTGSNISHSNTQIDVNKSSGQLGRSVAAWNLLTPIEANDYVEIMWSCDAATGQLFYGGTQTAPVRPDIPSVIATITQVA